MQAHISPQNNISIMQTVNFLPFQARVVFVLTNVIITFFVCPFRQGGLEGLVALQDSNCRGHFYFQSKITIKTRNAGEKYRPQLQKIKTGPNGLKNIR